MLTPERLLTEIWAVALRAGAEIMRHYDGMAEDGSGVETRVKDDKSPVTAADDAAEALILPALRRLTPNIPVVSEEEVSLSGPPDLGGARQFWLVDPLDGTKEFIKRRGEFTVNIGLVSAGIPAIGIVYAPAIKEAFGGIVGGHCLHSRDGETPQPIQARVMPTDGVTALVSRSHSDAAELDKFFTGLTIKERKDVGSSLKFCRIATGEADIYPRLGPTCEWDTCAGHAVVLAAGGSVETVEGGPLLYGKPTFLNPGFVVRGRQA